MSTTTKFLVSKKDILGELAKWAVWQSPFIPDGLEDMLISVRKKLSESGKFKDDNENFGNAEMCYTELRSFVTEVFNSSPEFKNLNLSKVEKEAGISVDDPSRPPFVGISRYDRLKEEHDFVDLDALIINVCHSIEAENTH